METPRHGLGGKVGYALKDKGLGGKLDSDELTLSVKLRLKKSEKDMILAVARLRKRESHDGKPPIAAVVVSSLRYAWKHIADPEAAEAEQDPHALSTQEALQSGLTPY